MRAAAGCAAAQRAAVDSADATGREHFDADGVRCDHRRSDRRRSPATAGDRRAQVRPGHLGDRAPGRRGQRFQLVPRQPDHHAPGVDRHGRGHGTRLPHRVLRRGRHLHVLRVGQAVADERRLEGDDGPAVAQGVGDLGGDGKTVGGDHAVRVPAPRGAAQRHRDHPGPSRRNSVPGARCPPGAWCGTLAVPTRGPPVARRSRPTVWAGIALAPAPWPTTWAQQGAAPRGAAHHGSRAHHPVAPR